LIFLASEVPLELALGPAGALVIALFFAWKFWETAQSERKRNDVITERYHEVVNNNTRVLEKMADHQELMKQDLVRNAHEVGKAASDRVLEVLRDQRGTR
jgi:hypothetical protein